PDRRDAPWPDRRRDATLRGRSRADRLADGRCRGMTDVVADPDSVIAPAGEPAPGRPGRGGRANSGRLAEWLVLYGLSVLAALVLSGVLVEATGGDWRPVFDALINGSLRQPGRWGETLGVAAPLLLVA